MIKFTNDKYVIGFTFRHQHFVYHFRYMKLQKEWMQEGRTYED